MTETKEDRQMDAKSVSTRELFRAFCEEMGTHAVTEESAILNAVPRELLPAFAVAVLDDSDAEPSPDYWIFLADSVLDSYAEAELDLEENDR
jgi:hypothetical protein